MKNKRGAINSTFIKMEDMNMLVILGIIIFISGVLMGVVLTSMMCIQKCKNQE